MIAEWTFLHPRMTFEMLGFIPFWLDEADPEPAAKQLDKHYKHGGGWDPTSVKFRMTKGHGLAYSGDPTMYPLAQAELREEIILFYPHSWVAILQPDGAFEVCRMD